MAYRRMLVSTKRVALVILFSRQAGGGGEAGVSSSNVSNDVGLATSESVHESVSPAAVPDHTSARWVSARQQ
jgi:hypothetical protein